MERVKTQDARINEICVCWPGFQQEFIVQPLGKSMDLSITRCAKTGATKDSVLLGSKHLDLCLEKKCRLKTGFSIDFAILALLGRPPRNPNHSLAPCGEGHLRMMGAAWRSLLNLCGEEPPPSLQS